MNHGNDVFFNELLRVHLDSPQALGGILEQTCLRMMPFTQFNDTEGSLSLAGHTAGLMTRQQPPALWPCVLNRHMLFSLLITVQVAGKS